MRPLLWLRATLLVLIPLCVLSHAQAAQYTAFSLKVAQQRIQQVGRDWRASDSDLVNLAGINQVEGFVYDQEAGDLILVGTKQPGRTALTLDDLAVALRARFRYNEWPLVSIDPLPDTEKTGQQYVRFEGGIQETAFGQALFEADYRLKQMAMGLEPTGVAGLATAWDRKVAGIEAGRASGEQEVDSRFWFYPTNPHVAVREGVCVVRGLKVGVFTEVLSARIGGKAVEDLKGFKDIPCDAFANDVSARFDDLCTSQPSFNRLRGLQELVAVSKALQELEPQPNLDYWLDQYPIATQDTPRQAKLLRRKYEGNQRSLEVSGGVHLTALAMRLNSGDVGALRQAVLKVRPSSQALDWSFVAAEWVIPLGEGQVRPEDIAPLFSQALFLQEQERHQDAIGVYNSILEINPRLAEAWSNKGAALGRLGRYPEELQCCEKALEINPRLAQAWSNKGAALHSLGRYQEALTCCDRALEINPRYAEVWSNKGAALGSLGRYQEALTCCDRALEINPRYDKAWYNKGAALYYLKRYSEARQAFEQAAKLGSAQASKALEILRQGGH